MVAVHDVRRVVLVFLDGLRPDAIELFDLRTIQSTMGRGAFTLEGYTVSPSVTAAAMTSLFTGVGPSVHGVRGDRFAIPWNVMELRPLPHLLREAGYTTSTFISRLPFRYRFLAHRMAVAAGVTNARFRGDSAPEIVAGAADSIRCQSSGLLFFHLPDADRAGHAHGWMSPAYLDACRTLDQAVAELISRIELYADPSTLLILMADHGGGGIRGDHHDSDHPLDRTVPIGIVGSAVRPGRLGFGHSLLDVPATILWVLGVSIPEGYAGNPMVEAFRQTLVAA